MQTEDFDIHEARGLSWQWLLHDNGRGLLYVAVPLTDATGGLVTVSRLLVNAPPGSRIKYLDGNRLNLRRENLFVGKGYSKGRERAAIQALDAAF
jgi:hypothetical protein